MIQKTCYNKYSITVLLLEVRHKCFHFLQVQQYTVLCIISYSFVITISHINHNYCLLQAFVIEKALMQTFVIGQSIFAQIINFLQKSVTVWTSMTSLGMPEITYLYFCSCLHCFFHLFFIGGRSKSIYNILVHNKPNDIALNSSSCKEITFLWLSAKFAYDKLWVKMVFMVVDIEKYLTLTSLVA